MHRNLFIRRELKRGADKTGPFTAGKLKTEQYGGFPSFLLVGRAYPGALFICEERKVHRAGNMRMLKFSGRTDICQYWFFFKAKKIVY
ncbi:hypothetical protein GCM10023091_08510 [Ravibacter arvi]|uniref:Uncharacterized protein n=1 Tax=Ravibacter arvi TaxID=2051041 RepID=A0ABP8LQQ0_9BACT